jgi:hypothetical protein
VDQGTLKKINYKRSFQRVIQQITSIQRKKCSWCGRRDLNPGSQAWKTPPKEINWNEFYVWMLKDHMAEYSRNTVVYAKKYYLNLLNHNFAEIRDLKDTIRPNALKALSCLAKYLAFTKNSSCLLRITI